MPLLLLPGLMCDDRLWKYQVEALADHDPVAVPGYPGARSITNMAEQALAMAPPSFALAGHSMGGRVALEILRMAPQRVERLALLDTGIHPPSEGEAAKRYELLDIARREGIARMIDLWLPPMVHPDRRLDEAWMKPWREMTEAGGVSRYEDQVAAMIARPDPRPLLARIDCPVLIGAGRQDEWSPVEQNRDIADQIPGARFHIFDDCGHMAPVEAPDQVSASFREWLSWPWPP